MAKETLPSKVKTTEDQIRLLDEYKEKKLKLLEKKNPNQHIKVVEHLHRVVPIKEGKKTVVFSDGDTWKYDYSISYNGPIETISGSHKQESMKKKRKDKTNNEELNKFFE